MDEFFEDEDVQDVDLEIDLLPSDDMDQLQPINEAEAQANSRFLSEESCGGRAPRFSNPTIERLNSFRYRKSPPKPPSGKEAVDQPLEPRNLRPATYDSVETRQRTAGPQISLRRAAVSRSSELAVRNAAQSKPVVPTPTVRVEQASHSVAKPEVRRSAVQEKREKPVVHEARRQAPAVVPVIKKAAPVKEFVPAVRSPPASSSVPAPRSRSNSRPTTPTSNRAPTSSSTPSTASAPSSTAGTATGSGNVKIPFSNSSRSAATIMSPIRQRNAMEAIAASITAHSDDPVTSDAPGSRPGSRATTPTSIRRARPSASEDQSESGGWNFSVRVKLPTPNEVAQERIQLLQMDSGEKPLPVRSGSRSRSASRDGCSVDGGSTGGVSSRLYPGPRSRSSTPTNLGPGVRRSQSGDENSILSANSSQNNNRSSRSPSRGARSTASLLSPYNMMVSENSMNAAKLTENDLKTIGKQLLLLKLLLEEKMKVDAETEEQDLLHAWQTVHDAEEQARTMTGQDAGIDEITRMHEQVAEMEQLVEKVTDHLAPVFDRLSTYVKLKEDEERAAVSSGAVEESAVDQDTKVQTHKELQARLTMLGKCVAIMKKNLENPELAVQSHLNGKKKAAINPTVRMTRRLSLNSHVTASAAARRLEDQAARDRAKAEAVSPVAPATQPKPKPARHSLGATPTARSKSPAPTNGTRRLSLNSNVTASAAARRAEDKAIHEQNAASATHTKVVPRPARQSLGTTKPDPSPVVPSPPATDKNGRRLSLNSHVTTSTLLRRSEEKAAREQSTVAAAKITPVKSRTSFGSTSSEPRSKSTPKSRPEDGQRRLSLNSHLTASQLARRTEVKQEHQAVLGISSTASRPGKSPPSKSPGGAVTHPAPFSRISKADSLDESEQSVEGVDTSSEAAAMRRLSLNSNLTASQKARRAELKQERDAAQSSHQPRSPSAPATRPSSATATGHVPFSTASSPPKATISPLGGKQSSFRATKANPNGSSNHNIVEESQSSAVDVADKANPVDSKPVMSSAGSPAAERQPSLRSIFSSIDEEEAPSSATTTAATAEAPIAPEIVKEEEEEEVVVSELPEPPVAETAVAPPLPPAPIQEPAQETPIETVVAPAVEQVVAPATETESSVDAHLNSMFEMKTDSLDPSQSAPAPALSTSEGSSALPVPTATTATPTTAEGDVADMRSPERKARSEAFERLMKRMNSNKDGKDTPPVSDSPVNSDSPEPSSGATPTPAVSSSNTNQSKLDEAVAPIANQNTEEVPDSAVPGNTAELIIDPTAAAVEGADAAATAAAAAAAAAADPIEKANETGVSALLSKFGEKSPSPKNESQVAPGASRPVPLDGLKREKSARVTELMNKFSNSPKKEPTPAAGSVPTSRPSNRASVSLLGSIAPIKSVFEGDSDSGSSAQRNLPNEASTAPVDAAGVTGDSAAAASATLAPIAESSSVETATESKVASVDVVEASVPAVVEEIQHQQHNSAASEVARSVRSEPAVPVDDVSEADAAKDTSERETVEVPEIVNAPIESRDEIPTTTDMLAPDTTNLESVDHEVDGSQDAIVNSDKQQADEPLDSKSGVGVVPCADSSIPVPIPAATDDSSTVEQTPIAVQEEDIRDEGEAAEKEQGNDEEVTEEQIQETIEVDVVGVTSTENDQSEALAIDVTTVEVSKQAAGEEEEPMEQSAEPSPALEPINEVAGSDKASDAGTEKSNPSKKRRPTLKGLWKRVKSSTGSSKGSPFESEGWKPSPIVEDTTVDDADVGAADWSTPDVFDSPNPSAKSSGVPASPSSRSAAEEESSSKRRRPTLKGIWNMVKSSKNKGGGDVEED